MNFKQWIENYQLALPFAQQEDEPDYNHIRRFKSKENYIKHVTKGSRKTENAAKELISAPPLTLHAPKNERIVHVVPYAIEIPEFTFPNGTTRPTKYIAFVHLETEESLNPFQPKFDKKGYRILAYWQGNKPFNKDVVFDKITRPIGGISGLGGYIATVWIDPDFRGHKANIPNLYSEILGFAKKLGIHGLMPEDQICHKCDQPLVVHDKPEKCKNCGTVAQPLTSHSYRTAQAKYNWKKANS